MTDGVKGSCNRKKADVIEEDENVSPEIQDWAEVKVNIRHFISGMMDLHREAASAMMSKEEKKILKQVFLMLTFISLSIDEMKTKYPQG